jgi:hypothetical protein
MSLTRTNFTDIAHLLNLERPEVSLGSTTWTGGAWAEWCTVVLAMADYCKRNANFDKNGNSLFNRERFLKACGFNA